MKLRGTFEDLKNIVDSAGVRGAWIEFGPDRWQFKTEDEAILNWWRKTGTISFQGPEQEKKVLSDAISAVISGSKPVEAAAAGKAPKPEIFVVHGHDTGALDQLELVLRRLDLDPYVLMNTAGAGMTIIEALEKKIGKRGEARFGIVNTQSASSYEDAREICSAVSSIPDSWSLSASLGTTSFTWSLK